MPRPTEPFSPTGGSKFDQSRNIIHCCLTINSVTVYTYSNPNITDLVNVNFSEMISRNLGLINSFQGERSDVINLAGNYSINKSEIRMCLYYDKKLSMANDLITIMILASDRLMGSFVYNVLNLLMNDYIVNYHESEEDSNFEFKIRMKELIESEEGKLMAVIHSYGSMGDEITQVRELMSENIDKVLQRGENLDSLINKTSVLNSNANYFRRRTTEVRRKFWWSNVKFWFIIFGIIGVLVYVVLGLECGLPFYSKCIHPNKPNQPHRILGYI